MQCIIKKMDIRDDGTIAQDAINEILKSIPGEIISQNQTIDPSGKMIYVVWYKEGKKKFKE